MTLFTPAARTQAKLRLAIDGPSGSGKTYSALLIAKGLAGGDLSKVALIDTERGSGSLYADLGPYAVAEMHPPFSAKKFMDALDAAVAEGFEVVVIDSLSHAWAGEGGVLDYVDNVAKTQTKGNSFTAWKEGTKVQNALIDHILAVPCHVIATMRTKTEWVIEENEKGKKVPRKIGMAVKQRDDVEYEFTTYINLSREHHIATASKDRTGLYDERFEVPSEAMGAELLAWLGSAAPVPKKKLTKAAIDEQREQAAGNGDAKQLPPAAQKRLSDLIESRGRLIPGVLAAAAKKGIGSGTIDSLTMAEATKIAEAMKQLPEVAPEPPDEPASAPEPELTADDFDEAATAASVAAAIAEPDDADFAAFDAELTKAAEEKVAAAAEREKQPVVTSAQMKRLHATATEAGVDHAELSKYARVMFGVASMKELRRTEAVLLLQFLRGEQAEQEMPVAS